MGSGHPMQVDGLGGAHPLASKVAVVSVSGRRRGGPGLPVPPARRGRGDVTDQQNCGNILAGVGPFAAERGLIEAGREQTTTRIRMVNSGSVVTATFATPGGRPCYAGDTAIAGVPGRAAPVLLRFAGTEGSATGRLLATGQITDVIDGIEVTCVDNGMPVVVARAADLGVTGTEEPPELAADAGLAARVQSLRLAAGALMGLGDVSGASVPKTTLVSAPARRRHDRHPHVHPGAPAHRDRRARRGQRGHRPAAARCGGSRPGGPGRRSGGPGRGGSTSSIRPGTWRSRSRWMPPPAPPRVRSAGVIRTARKLFDGIAYPAGP